MERKTGEPTLGVGPSARSRSVDREPLWAQVKKGVTISGWSVTMLNLYSTLLTIRIPGRGYSQCSVGHVAVPCLGRKGYLSWCSEYDLKIRWSQHTKVHHLNSKYGAEGMQLPQGSHQPKWFTLVVTKVSTPSTASVARKLGGLWVWFQIKNK